MKKSYSSAERKSYKRGFFAGLFASKKPKLTAMEKFERDPKKYRDWHNQYFDNNALYRAAYFSASNEGRKLRFSDDQVLMLARDNYFKARKDKNFRDKITHVGFPGSRS